jgi:hypothetical protein
VVVSTPASRGEISYDLVMADDMHFAEGTYRLSGQDWSVVIVSRADVEAPVATASVWPSGVRGLFVRWPRDAPMNAELIERFLSVVLGVTTWSRCRGPDSMVLR